MLKEFTDDKKIQSELLNIMIEIDRVCKILGIKYTLSGGSLLGAIRHKGFIPWDDDMDIAMTRDNYEKFLKYAQRELKDNYFLQTYETDSKSPCNFAKVLNTKMPIIEKDKVHLNIKKGLFVDIFPIDKTFNSYWKRFISVLLIRIAKTTKYSCNLTNILKNSENNLKKAGKLLLFPIAHCLGNNKLNCIETYARKLANNKENNVTFADQDQAIFAFKDKEMKWDIFCRYKLISFEGYEFMCISDYDMYLRKLYGNYMQLPPIEEQKPHHGLLIDD